MTDHVFVVTLPPNRSGGTPACDKWTFHHVLPWKYFYCLGSLLGYYLSALVLNFNQAPGAAAAPPNRQTLNDKFLGIIECSTEIEMRKGLLAMAELDRLLNGLARTPNGISARLAEQNSAARIVGLFVECTSPVFGGFPGMDGNQRNDDPKSTMEQTRPFNAEAAWWIALQAIGAQLQLSSTWPIKHRQNTKSIASAGYGDKVKFKLSDAQIESEILAHLRILVAPKYNTTVLPFDVKSWNCHHDGQDWSFNITANPFEPADYAASITNLKFSVSTTDSHLGKKKHLEYTRCPSVDNEMNLLRPTKSTLATLRAHA